MLFFEIRSINKKDRTGVKFPSSQFKAQASCSSSGIEQLCLFFGGLYLLCWLTAVGTFVKNCTWLCSSLKGSINSAEQWIQLLRVGLDGQLGAAML